MAGVRFKMVNGDCGGFTSGVQACAGDVIVVVVIRSLRTRVGWSIGGVLSEMIEDLGKIRDTIHTKFKNQMKSPNICTLKALFRPPTSKTVEKF